MSKTTLDLSTLPDIADGTHTVKVKAKADGYRDSEFSNEVSYTKISQQSYKFHFFVDYDVRDFLTYLKFGSPPENDTDYDIYATAGGSGVLRDGTEVYDGYIINNQANVAYVWGYKYETNIAGSVTLGYTNYTDATQVQLTGVTDITLYGGNY